VKEDKEFLLVQREKRRRRSMGSIDTKLSKKEERRNERQFQNEMKQKKTTIVKEKAEMSKVVDLNINFTYSHSSSSDNDVMLYVPTSKRLKQINSPKEINTLKPTSIVTSDVVSALDKTKVNDRNAMYVLSATIQGSIFKTLLLIESQFWQARREYREKIVNELKASFVLTIPLTVHWDGKRLLALMSKDKVHCLAVIVSGDGVMKLLGEPKIPNGTGKAQSTAVYDLLKEWNLIECIYFMSFDTTASNSGVNSGACVFLEK